MLTLNDGRSELWQWDTGRTLAVDADCSQVHFSNKVFGRSIDVDVIDGVAAIPDILLQTDKELTAWAFVGTAENGYTKISKVFKVNKRNKPADYVFTPTEQTTLGELIERLDKIEESQDPDAIKNAVDDYLANNPIEIDETDPTVPEWAKQPTKPSYTASEVGALSADTVIPTIPDNVSAFRNDAGYLTEHQDLTGYATERYVQGYAQPKGDYLTAIPDGYAKIEDIPTRPEDIGAQPAGNYLTEVPSGYATEEFVKNKIAEAELGGEEVDLSGYAQKSELPTKVSQLENDSGYLTEHQDISGKLDASALPSAINSALAQAKASGEFDGKDGVDGVSATHSWNGTVLTITSASGTSSADLKGAKGDKGDTGATGQAGKPGADGKTAYAYAQDGGYTGTEEEFAALMAGNALEPADGDIPKVFLTGDEFGNMTTDKNEVNMELDYYSQTKSFHAYIAIKFQGNTSLNYDKKNFTVKLFDDAAHETKQKHLFRDWRYAKNKFVLKANYIDHSHARNIMGANLWNEVVASRSDYSNLPEELRNSPKNGAIDGFPIKLYVNGTYQGIYTWNIGKDDWMWGMDEDNANHTLLCVEHNTDGKFKETPSNFRALWTTSANSHFEVEVGTRTDAVRTSVNNLISFVMSNDGDAFRNGIGAYLDVQSAIDYYLHQYVICGLDGLAKNMLLATYDGTKWICGAYDMDGTFGIYWDGKKFVSPNYKCPEDYQEKFNLLWERLEANFWSEIKTRYAELRRTVFTVSNMFTHFERFMDTIGLDLYAEDLTIYSSIPSGSTNNIKQLRDFIRDRLVYCDSQITNGVPGLSVTLSQTALSLKTEAATITATASPSNTTDGILWATSDPSVATVNNGIVTPVADGSCTIVAKCGSGYGVCEVTVSTKEPEAGYTNQVPLSIDTDGSVFNGIGYQNGYRLSTSTGETKAETNSTVSGYIPAKAGDVIRVYGVDWYNPSGTKNAIAAYDRNFGYIGALYGALKGTATSITKNETIVNENDIMVTLKATGVAYIRVNSMGLDGAQDGANMIVTVNEEIT